MASGTELVLLISTESDITPGIALARRVIERSRFSAEIRVVSEQPGTLLELVKSSLGKYEQPGSVTLSVASAQPDIEQLIAALNSLPALQLVLVPGLDQMNGDRKRLLKEVHGLVVCFESHPGLLETPSELTLIDCDQRGCAKWLAEHLVPHPSLQCVGLEDLQGSVRPSSSEPAVVDEPQEPIPAESSGWVLLATDARGVDGMTRRARAAIETAAGPVMLVRCEDTWLYWLVNRSLPDWFARILPQIPREARRELAANLTNHSSLDFEFIALICSATFLASFGLVQDSAAVIIGAMLVAPLMTPILGAGLSLAQGNRPLFVSSLRTIAIGFLAALTTSFLFGMLLQIIPNTIWHRTDEGIVMTHEMWSRTSPGVIDFLVGLVGGSAAAFARTRTHLSSALAGAAIAAALVPPIATAGLQLSLVFESITPLDHSAQNPKLIYGPVMLFIANMLTIMIGSSFVLWGCGVRSEHSYSTKERWTSRMTIMLMTLTAIVAVWITQ